MNEAKEKAMTARALGSAGKASVSIFGTVHSFVKGRKAVVEHLFASV